MSSLDRRRAMMGAGFACVALVLVGCGGRQTPAPAAVETPAETTPCISDRWDQPPPQIGQTPPDEPAPEGALDAFEPADDLP